jgi:aminoglycoside phosphotransferase family enzyme/predicted kinase
VETRDPRLAEHRTLVAALRSALGDAELIETHISTLLLAGDFAYKLRKPLTLGFLDFSTAQRRRVDCEEELRLNRRTAPQLYLDVLPVFGPAAQARVGRADEPGVPIDWLLRMRRFDNDGLLDRLAARGELTDTLVDVLAARVASFHESLPASPAAYGDPQVVLAWSRANFDALGSAAPTALREWTEQEYARVAPLLALRRAQGFVREGHGDLHLGNIVLVDGEPLPFDGIEFNAALRHTDTMADLAFPFMDLWRHGLPRQAWRFVSSYAEHTGDYGGLALLPFFAVYRALVRAQVASLRVAQAGDETAREAARTALARDLHVASALSQLRQATPTLVLCCGLSGSGKSTVALGLLQPLGAVRIRSDVERKRLAGVAVTARPTAGQARELYSLAMNTRTYARLQSLARELLRAGLNVIVDAAALRRHERDDLRALATAAGARFVLVECTAPEAVLRERIARRRMADHDASDATLEVLDFQLGIHEPLAADESAFTLPTDCDAATLAARCDALAETLRQ